MLRSLIKILSLTSLAVLVVSCTPGMFRGLKSAGKDFTGEKAKLFRAGEHQSLVYKTTVHFREREFSSLTYVNALNDSVFKIVLLSTFGNTLLEAEISGQEFKVDNVISYLDRKPILKLVEKDWRLLLGPNFSPEIPAIFSESPGETVFCFGSKRSHRLYHYDAGSKAVKQIEAFKGKRKKTVVTADSQNNFHPEKFSMEHEALKLKITFSLLDKVSDDSPE